LKENQYETEVPCPGTYTIEERHLAKTSFGKRFDYKSENFPGPGDYNPDFEKTYTKIKYTFPKTEGPKRAKTPGPGDYNLRTDNDFKKPAKK